jgi:hypothetical protein
MCEGLERHLGDRRGLFKKKRIVVHKERRRPKAGSFGDSEAVKRTRRLKRVKWWKERKILSTLGVECVVVVCLINAGRKEGTVVRERRVRNIKVTRNGTYSQKDRA